MDLKKLSEPLTVEQIDFRVQSINKGGYATILAYKDARVDMQRLDEVCGPLNWERTHTRDNKNCTIRVWDDHKKIWVSKEDTGVESNTEKEKGLASDSFKRAGFNWGIGRELYDYPLIQVKLENKEVTEKNGKFYASWHFKLREWTWKSGFSGGKISFLQGIDTKGVVRFTWKDGVAEPEKKKDDVPNYDPPKTKTQNEADIRSWKGLCDEAAKKDLDVFRDWFKANKDDIQKDCGVEGMTAVYNHFTTVGKSLASKEGK